MQWIAAMQQAISYMETHLMEEINYEDVARQVHISSYEFHRTFSFLTGMTPNAYIRSRRLSLAGRQILETDDKITDIALQYGYETPESFTKAFTRFHGVAPQYAREASAKLVLFNPLVIKLTVEGGKSMDYRIVKTEAQRFLAMTGSFSNSIIQDEENHEIPDFWDACQQKDMIGPMLALKKAGERDLYGLCTPAKEGEDSFDYGIGVLLDPDIQKSELERMEGMGYRVWDVKPGTYVVFDCMGADGDCISETWSKFYKEFLPQMGYEAVEETDYEIYPEQGRQGLFCELWIPVKKK